jgi:hypothetical protein
MATDAQTDAAAVAVGAGTASREQIAINARMAQQAGSRGNAAREAQKAAGKGK